MSSNFVGKPFAVLLVGETPNGEDDWAVFPGILRKNVDGLFLDRGNKPPFAISDEWSKRIKQVGVDFKDIFLGAKYYLPLTIGQISDGESMENYMHTGLRYPE